MKKLDTLYKKTSTGADQFWEIGVVGAVIVTRWGQIGGKVQETSDHVKEGKNTGRANATTPEEQACSEATSLWEKKLKKGYVKDISSARAGKVDSSIKGGVFPMLAEKYSEQGDKLSFPCYDQPKFDGHRCVAMIDNHGKATLWTRSRKLITSMGHIINELERMGLKGVTLDGELYNHDYKDNFEDLTSFIRDSTAKPGADVVQLHVYDVINGDTQEKRAAYLAALPMASPIMRVMTLKAESEDELMAHFELYLSMGYEGAMARNASGRYVNKRSTDLLKIKKFMDEEFKVVGVEEGRGKLAGHGIFVCQTKGGETFKAKMMGDTSALKKYWDDPDLAIGRRLTVKFQGYTKKNNVPRFPVALRFRDE